MTKPNYANFYLAILCGMAFIGGMLSAGEFGFFSYKWLVTLFYFCFGCFVSMLYVYELNKKKMTHKT